MHHSGVSGLWGLSACLGFEVPRRQGFYPLLPSPAEGSGGPRKPSGYVDALALSAHFSCPVLTTLSALPDCEPRRAGSHLTSMCLRFLLCKSTVPGTSASCHSVLRIQ